jgi:hypothetical protein
LEWLDMPAVLIALGMWSPGLNVVVGLLGVFSVLCVWWRPRWWRFAILVICYGGLTYFMMWGLAGGGG